MNIPRRLPARAAGTIIAAVLASAGCSWQGLNSLPLPGTAGGGSAVEHDAFISGVEAEALEVVGDGQTGLTGADDHN